LTTGYRRAPYYIESADVDDTAWKQAGTKAPGRSSAGWNRENRKVLSSAGIGHGEKLHRLREGSLGIEVASSIQNQVFR
jgi:hypothetical protein